jgi:hypothetical protein
MRMRRWVVGIVVVLVNLAYAQGLPPWPTPPPDDDDFFLCTSREISPIIEAVATIAGWPGTVTTLGSGGMVVRIGHRGWRDAARETLVVDALLWLGTSELPGYDRFKVARCTRVEHLASGERSLGVEESPELLLRRWFDDSAAVCVADTTDGLRALAAALGDANVRELADSLLPHFALAAVRTPIGGNYGSGQTISVTLEFVNQTDRDDRYALIVDMGRDGGGAPAVKSLRAR